MRGQLPYQSIIEAFTEAAFITDLDCRVRCFNAAAERLTGWNSSDVVGRRCSEAFYAVGHCPRSRPGAEGEGHDDPSQQPVSSRQELVHQPDGRVVEVVDTQTIIRGQRGSVHGAIHILREGVARPSSEVVPDAFMSMAAHQLRSPLGHVKGYASTLLRPDLAWDQSRLRASLEVIVKATDDLEALLDKLLSLSMVGAGGALNPSGQLRLEPVLNAVIGGTIHLPSNLALRLRIPDALPPVVGDDTLISQVFHNLLDNAVKYSPAGGQITIAAIVTASVVIVTVDDEGLGIPLDELSKVFHPFYRGIRVRTHDISGSGLGLALCRKIVSAYGGRIWINSPSPHRSSGSHPGTTVTVALRVAGPVAVDRETEHSSLNGRDRSKHLATLWTAVG